MSSTRSARKLGEKAQPTVVEKLLAIKRAPLVPASIEAAASGTRRLGAKRLAQLETDLQAVQRSIQQIQDIRDRLSDVPALPQRGSVL